MQRTDLSKICLVVCWCALWPRPAASQAYRFTKIVDGSTQRPDGLGVFFLNYARTTPAFDGTWVVFRDQGPQNDDGSHAAIFSYNLQDRQLRTLVDFKKDVPGGSAGAKFHNFLLTGSAPVLRNGIVIFAARDTANREGLYSVPASGGGPIARVADPDTTDPSGGTFTLFEPFDRRMGAFSFDGSTVAFNANGSAQVAGNYSARADGSNLGLIADGLHPAQNGKIISFQTPAISGQNVVMAGSDGMPNGTGYNGLYLGTVGGTVGGAGAVTELLNSTQQLPGNTNFAFHTRFDSPVLAFDGNLMAFLASDSNSGSPTNPAGHFGLYSSVLGSGAMQLIADVNSTTLKGLGKLRAIALEGVAVNQNSILFQATDTTGANALFLSNGGAITRLIGTGDTLDGQKVVRVADPGPAALSSSSFVFMVDFGGRPPSLYAATSLGVSVGAVTNAASYAAQSIAPGEIVTVFGSAMGPATLAYYAFDAKGLMPDTLAGAQILFNGIAAPLIYVSDTQSAAIVPFETTGQQAQIVVRYNGGDSSPVTMPLTNTSPGLFSADKSGSGPGAILNADGSYNSSGNPAVPGAVVVLWASGLGQLAPAPANGSIIPISPLPALLYAPKVSIGGQEAVVDYAGPAPQAIAGLYQINCRVPAGISPGLVAVVITVDGRQSRQDIMLAVGP